MFYLPLLMDIIMDDTSDEDENLSDHSSVRSLSLPSDLSLSDLSDESAENMDHSVAEIINPLTDSEDTQSASASATSVSDHPLEENNELAAAAPAPVVSSAENVTPSTSKSDNKKCTSPPARDSSDDDGQICTICFEPWTNTSEHRLVSLRCGHLFGRSCITRWLKGQNARCPQCNARARKSEIRNIYAKSIKVMDSSERDKALRDLMKESELRRKAEIDAAQERLKHMMAVQENERLKKELMETKKLLQEYRTSQKIVSSQSTSSSSSPAFSLEKMIDISKNGGSRVVDASVLLGMILISTQSSNELFPGYGFRKVDITEMKPAEFVLVHQKPIRDLAFHMNDGLVLTGSLDKSVKITNVLSNSVVQTYQLPSDVWSCAWDADDPVYFYSGLKTGEVFVFDIRVTSRHVSELECFGAKTPVVSLQYLRKSETANHRKCGPLVGKLSDCSFYQKSENYESFKVVPLPPFGPFTCLSTESGSGHFLVSCRPSNKQPRVNHTICEFVETGPGDLICNPVQTVLGGRTQVQLTKSKLLSHPDKESSLLLCAGDEDARGALVWDGSSGACLDRLSTDSPVLDFAGLKLNHRSILATITDKKLRLYKWNS